jgi:MFS transporter, Spinster family, sphingosine-1-phosphate transporter
VNAPTAGEPRLHPGPARRALALLTAVNLVGYLDRYVIAALFESLRADLWLTDARLGFLGTGFVVLYVLASPLLARAGERRSRPRLLALGVAVWSAATVLSGFARGFWTLLAARAAVGLGQAAHGALSPGLVADHLLAADRRRAHL